MSPFHGKETWAEVLARAAAGAEDAIRKADQLNAAAQEFLANMTDAAAKMAPKHKAANDD